MEWLELFGSNIQPTEAEINQFIANPMWKDFNDYIQNEYKVMPKYSFSGCSGQPGWNVKYQKSGRSLCTLYPMFGYFIALVVIGLKEEDEMQKIFFTLEEHIKLLLNRADSIMGARWLMIHVTSEEILNDVKRLIQIRVNTKRGK